MRSGGSEITRTKTDFPHQIRVIEHAVIPLSDGVTLSAMIWLPVDAEKNPVPAILEYLPYRKRDGTTERDALTHPYFAGHGYACVRVPGKARRLGVTIELLKLPSEPLARP